MPTAAATVGRLAAVGLGGKGLAGEYLPGDSLAGELLGWLCELEGDGVFMGTASCRTGFAGKSFDIRLEGGVCVTLRRWDEGLAVAGLASLGLHVLFRYAGGNGGSGSGDGPDVVCRPSQELDSLSGPFSTL